MQLHLHVTPGYTAYLCLIGSGTSFVTIKISKYINA